MSARARPSSASRPTVTAPALEALEPRALLSHGAPLGPARDAAHAHHVRHVHHLRHLRQAIRQAAAAARATTDRQDYLPGDKAAITGTGFRAGEAVRVQVLHIDGTPNTAAGHRPWTVTADARGRIATTYPVGDDDLNTTMELIAVGQRSGRVAKHVFTDAVSATTTTLGSSASPSVFGQPITLTARVTGGSTAATGSVTFKDGTTTLGTVTIGSGGVATFTTAGLGVGSHAIKATYGGDTRHGASTSAALAQSVSAAQTAVTVSSSTAVPASAPVLRPDHVVIVMMEDRFVNAIGDTAHLPYVNQLAASGLVFSNSTGLNTPDQEGEMDYLGLYSGSTQGVTDNGYNYTFNGPNIGASLNAVAGLSFAGYSENLPADGSQVLEAGDGTYPDLYMRHYNPMAMFTNAGPGKTNADVNKTFNAFPSNFAALPTVSLVVPNALHNTHGSNDRFPWAGGDPDSYDLLRTNADAWLQQKIDPYVQWARSNNSLLIVTTDELDRQHPGSMTTFVVGDPRLVTPGTDATPINHYNVLRSIEDMYGLSPLGNSAAVPGLDTNAQGKLGVPGSSTSATSAAGQSVNFTAKVAPVVPGAGTPAGAVQFVVDGANFGSPVAVNASGVATSAATASLGAGSHTVTAVFTPSTGNFAGSTSAAFTQTVTGANQQASATALTSNANPATAGQTVTFTATVSGAGAVATGTVTFKDGATTIGTAMLANGVATFATSALASGSHAITAVYGGDANYTPSTSATLSETVNAPAAVNTSTAVSSSAGTTVFGQAVTFTATVTAAGGSATPSGTVQFQVDGANVGAAVTLSAAGTASISLANLTAGSHQVTAAYAGNASFNASASAAITQQVNRAATGVSLASSANPSTSGQSVTFTATVGVAAPGAGSPSGTVTFFDGATVLGSGTVTNGVATLTTPVLTVGSHTITAAYNGDANFAAGTSAGLAQTVNPGSGAAADAFANRGTLSGTAITATASNVGATKEAGEPQHAGNAGGHSIWWTWTAPSDGVVTIDTLGSSFDTLLAVYTGSAVNALAVVPGGSNDDSPAGGTQTSKVSFGVTAGTTYQIAIDGYNGLTGNVTLHLNLAAPAVPAAPSNVAASDALYTDKVRVTWGAVSAATSYEVWRATSNSSAAATKLADVTGATTFDDTTAVAGTTYYYFVKATSSAGASAFSTGDAGTRAAGAPANDNFANRTAISGATVTVSGTNGGATKETGEPAHAANSGGHSVWYTWTATASGTVTLDTLGSNFDTLLAVYKGTAVNGLTTVASNDDSAAGGTQTSKLTFAATAGTTYQIAIDGYGGAVGTFNLHLTLA